MKEDEIVSGMSSRFRDGVRGEKLDLDNPM